MIMMSHLRKYKSHQSERRKKKVAGKVHKKDVLVQLVCNHGMESTCAMFALMHGVRTTMLRKGSTDTKKRDYAKNVRCLRHTHAWI
jgi:hypothetical protein